MDELKYQSTEDQYFESIRPYLDHEVRPAVVQLLQHPVVQEVISQITPPEMSRSLDHLVQEVDSVSSFKSIILAPILYHLLSKNAFSVTTSGRSQLSKDKRYLFISNHRDIVMDSALINASVLKGGLSLPRIAIGDNLLIEEWIRSLVRLAGAFVVIRKPSIREMLAESERLSHYIRTSIVGGEESVWLAQREGRTKDSNDTTQTALLKMLTLSSNERDPGRALAPLNIVPVSLSYEYDPCDFLKAKEMLQKELDPSFTKSPMDDLISMQTGVMGQKGRVHITFAQPLSHLEEIGQHTKNRQEVLEMAAKEIDRGIFLNYRFYPCNYIAYDLQHGGSQFAKMYSNKERAAFELYLQQQIDKIKMEGKDSHFLLQRLLEMYSNPLRNNLLAKKELRS
ncbi:MAG: hypothetical protein Q4D93_05720 [Porphyromonas sp.]|nr:hypothetical protein [Porphyromonas sp.]